jgi:prevent-host-death family protein
VTTRRSVSLPDDVARYLDEQPNISAAIADAIRLQMATRRLEDVLRRVGMEVTEEGKARWRFRLTQPIPAEALAEGRRLLDEAGTGEPVIITKYERPVAVLVGIDEWEEIEAFRDRRDSAVIARSRAEGQFVPLSAALESLGVDLREVEALLADRANGEAARSS